MRKYEVGKSKPTENKASNAIVNQETDKWVAKIDEAAKVEGINSKIEAGAKVLIELAEEIKVGRIDIEVFRGVLRRRNVTASLTIAYNKLRYMSIR